MRLFLIVFIVCSAAFAESFITMREYGEALYKRYESISCAVCHGENGGGRQIAAYYSDRRNAEISIDAPYIRNYNERDLARGIAKHRLAPQYQLAADELTAIAAYLKE